MESRTFQIPISCPVTYRFCAHVQNVFVEVTLVLRHHMHLTSVLCCVMLWKQSISPWVHKWSICFGADIGLVEACELIRNTSMSVTEVEMLMNTNAAVSLARWRVHGNISSGLLDP